MKKISKILTSLTAVATSLVPTTLLVSCGDQPTPPGPKPVVERHVTIDEAQKTKSLTNGEINFSYTFATDWVIGQKDVFTVNIKKAVGSTPNHTVQLSVAPGCVGTQELKINGVYKTIDGSEILDDSLVNFKVEIACQNEGKKYNWSFEGFSTRFNHAKGTLSLDDPSQIDAFTNPGERTYVYTFNIGSCQLTNPDNLDVNLEVVDHLGSVDKIKVLSKAKDDYDHFILTIGFDEGTLEEGNYVSFKLHGKYKESDKILWIQDSLETFKLTYQDVKEDLAFMPTYEKQGATYDHLAGTGHQLYTIYFKNEEISYEDIELKEIISRDGDEFAYETSIEEGESLGDYSYAILDVNFKKTESELWTEDHDVKFDIVLTDTKNQTDYTFDKYLFKFITSRVNDQAVEKIAYDDSHKTVFTTTATFAESENVFECYPVLTSSSREGISVRFGTPKVKDGKISIDIELYSNDSSVQVQDGDWAMFDMFYSCGVEVEGTTTPTWYQYVSDNKLTYTYPVEMTNKIARINYSGESVRFQYLIPEGHDWKIPDIRNFKSDTIKKKSGIKGGKSGRVCQISFEIEPLTSFRLGNSATFDLEVHGFDTSKVAWTAIVKDCQILINYDNIQLDTTVKVRFPPKYEEEQSALRTSTIDYVKKGTPDQSRYIIKIDMANFQAQWPGDDWHWVLCLPKDIDDLSKGFYPVYEDSVTVKVDGVEAEYQWSETGPIDINSGIVKQNSKIEIALKLNGGVPTDAPRHTTFYFTYSPR